MPGMPLLVWLMLVVAFWVSGCASGENPTATDRGSAVGDKVYQTIPKVSEGESRVIVDSKQPTSPEEMQATYDDIDREITEFIKDLEQMGNDQGYKLELDE